MGIKPCRECGKETSTEAEACPHCGASAPTREKSGDWVPCTKCGSAKTQKIGKGLMGFASLMMSGCLIWIPVIGWVMAPIFLVSAVILWILALIPSGKVTFRCESCKQWFTIPKSELKKI